MNDEQLFAAYLESDDKDAFANLFNRHYRPQLLILLASYGPEAAEDAVQETYMDVWASRESFDPSRKLHGWLATIAMNRAKDVYRHDSRKHRRTCSLTGGVKCEDGFRLDYDPVDPRTCTPQDVCEKAELCKLACDITTADEKILLVEPASVAAESLGIKSGNVATKKCRTAARIRAQLGE